MTTLAAAQTHGPETVVIETSEGNIKVRLFTETPLHRANFLRLVNSGFYDSTLFHRVIRDFMIQGGDSLSRAAKPGDSLGHGDPSYTIPAEIRPDLHHYPGRLCAARESDELNPTYASSGSEFYIVVGKKRSNEDLDKYESRITQRLRDQAERLFLRSPEGLKLLERTQLASDSASLRSAVATVRNDVTPYRFTAEQRAEYTERGGTPHLDGTYTVFGEVVEGFDVVRRISLAGTDKRDRPLKDVRLRMYVER